jgi:hypothetical protein
MLIDPNVREQVLEGQDGDKIILTCYENEDPVEGQIAISLRQPSKTLPGIHDYMNSSFDPHIQLIYLS